MDSENRITKLHEERKFHKPQMCQYADDYVDEMNFQNTVILNK